MKLAACSLLVACAAGPSPRPNTIYHPRPGGAIDLSHNPFARHCSELTKDFRTAYGLEDAVKTISSVGVSADEQSVILSADGRTARASLLVGDRSKLRAFWHYDDWTLAMTIDHGSCTGDVCPADIWMIKYNGADSPYERPTKLCFEHWTGKFARVSRLITDHRTSSR